MFGRGFFDFWLFGRSPGVERAWLGSQMNEDFCFEILIRENFVLFKVKLNIIIILAKKRLAGITRVLRGNFSQKSRFSHSEESGTKFLKF